MVTTDTPPALQAENAAAGTTAQGPISTPGASGNTQGNDSTGIPMDDEAALDALFNQLGDTPPVEHQPPETVTQQPPAGVQTPPAQDAVPVAPTETGTPAAPLAERILPNRIGTGQFSPTTQRALSLMHELNGGKPEGEGAVTLADCLNMVAQADGRQPVVIPAQAPAPEPVTPAPLPSEALRAEVEALEAQITSAGENSELFGPELSKATIELSRKSAALATAEAQEAQQRQSEHQTHINAREAVKAAVVAEFRGADDPSSILGSRVAALISEMTAPTHPWHGELNKVEVPRFVVEQAARQVAQNLAKDYGITEAQAMASLRLTPQATTTQAPAVQPLQELPPVAGNRNVTVAAGSIGTGGAQIPLTDAQFIAKASEDPDGFDAALGYTAQFRL